MKIKPLKPFILVTYALILLSGCGQSSKITPFMPVKSVSEQQGRVDGLSVFKATYLLKPDDGVSSPTQLKLPIGNLLNGLFNSLTNGLGNLILSMQKNRDVEIDPIVFEIPQDEIDFDLVRQMQLTGIKFEVDEPVISRDSNFQFIDKIQVFVPRENEKDLSRIELEERGDTLLAEYNVKDKDFVCQTEKKCMRFKLKKVNLIDLLKDRERIFIKTYIVVRKVPKKEFKIKGAIDVEVKLKLPF